MIQTSNIKDGAITSAKIASKTITGDNIADSTIKAQNVDFETIYEVVESKETEYTIPTSKTQVWSKQVEKSGLYMLNVFVEGNDTGSSHAIDYNIDMGSKSYHKWWISGMNQNSRYCACGSVSYNEILNANDTIKLSLWRSARAGSSFNARVLINLVRIG